MIGDVFLEGPVLPNLRYVGSGSIGTPPTKTDHGPPMPLTTCLPHVVFHGFTCHTWANTWPFRTEVDGPERTDVSQFGTPGFPGPRSLATSGQGSPRGRWSRTCPETGLHADQARPPWHHHPWPFLGSPFLGSPISRPWDAQSRWT